MKTRLIAALGALAVLAVVVVAAATGTDGTGAIDNQPLPKDEPRATAVDPQLQGQLGIFRRPTTAPDRMPEDLRLAVEQGPARLGANSDLSRFAQSRGDLSMYLVPASERVCMLFKDAEADTVTGGCGRESLVRTGGYLGFTQTRAGIAVRGVVPDGVTGVVLHLADGSSLDGAVTNNSYLLVAKGEPVRVSFEGGGLEPVAVPYADPNQL